MGNGGRLFTIKIKMKMADQGRVIKPGLLGKTIRETVLDQELDLETTMKPKATEGTLPGQDMELAREPNLTITGRSIELEVEITTQGLISITQAEMGRMVGYRPDHPQGLAETGPPAMGQGGLNHAVIRLKLS